MQTALIEKKGESVGMTDSIIGLEAVAEKEELLPMHNQRLHGTIKQSLPAACPQAGNLNPQQPALLRGAMEKVPEGSVIILGFIDPDEGGKARARGRGVCLCGDRELRRIVPDAGKDWN